MINDPNSVDPNQVQEEQPIYQPEAKRTNITERIRNTGINTYNRATKAKNFGQKAYNGARKAGTAVKNAANATAKAATKAAKAIAKAVAAIGKAISYVLTLIGPWGVIAILAVALIIAVVMLIQKELNVDVSIKSTHDSAESVIKEMDANNLSDQQKSAKETFEKSGSVIDFSLSDINKMVKKVDEERKGYSSGSDKSKAYKRMFTTMGDNDVSADSRIVSPDDKVSLYEHMLLISKYDFNNIKWSHFGHGHNGESSPMKEDKELGIKYPSDQENTKATTFTSLLKPYLLSYEIPMAFFSGLADNEKNQQSEKFVYSIIKNALSDVTVNRYDVQEYNLATSYKDYVSKTYEVEYSVSITPTGNGCAVTMNKISTPKKIDEKNVNTRRNENGEEDVMLEEVIKDNTFTSVKNTYYISSAKIFDQKINNEYKYVPYSESDANSRKNPDSEVYEEVPYNEIINEDIKKGIGGYTTMPGTTPEQVKESIIKKYNGELIGDSLTEFKFKATYEERDGVTHYVTRNWRDVLSSSKSESDFYSIDDVIEYNENYESNPITKDDFNSDSDSVKYYKNFEERKLLNRVDFINSNPSIYKTYIKGDSYAKYVGIHRNYLSELCYTTLKELWQDLVIKYKTFPYVYGKTYGFGNSTGSSDNLASGIDLLRLYIQSFEGDGAYKGGGRFDENHNKVTGEDKEGKTKYYKVYNAGDDVRTVGYGVNINKQESRFRELGIDPSTINYGDYVESAIVDKIENAIIKEKLDNVIAVTSGLDLEEYQLHAIVTHCYVAPVDLDSFNDLYNKYWNKDSDNKYEELFEKYKDNEASALSSIESARDLENKLYKNWFYFYNGMHDKNRKGTFFPGWPKRQISEFTLFQTGYYTTLKRFWRNSEGTPGGIVLTNGDTIDLKACLDLQNWFEDNLFSGKIPKADPDPYKFSYIKAGDDFVDTYGYLNKDYSNLYRPVYYYQCPWWSYFRGALYFNLVGRDDLAAVLKNGGRTGCGLEAATKASEYLGLTLNTSIDGIKPYSIISFGSSGDGHTAFVEAVTSTSIVLSQCSGRRGELNEWNGITIYNKNDLGRLGGFRNSVCLADAL